MKKNMNMVMLAGAIVVLSTVVANAVMMTLFTGWSGLIERKSPDIIVARCLKTPDPDYDEAADSWELSYFDMTNFASFATNLADKSNPVSAYLLEAISHQKLKFFSPSELTTGTNADNMLWASVMENLNEVIYGPSIYESNRFRTVRLRPETGELLKKHPQEPELAQLNRMLLEDAYLREIVTKHFKTGLLRSQHTSPVFESDIEVLSVLKGATKLGVSRLETMDFLPRQGEYYLIMGQYFRRRFCAIEDFRIVPLGMRFNSNWIIGQTFDQQIATLLRQGLDEANRQLDQAQKEKARLEEAFPFTNSPPASQK